MKERRLQTGPDQGESGERRTHELAAREGRGSYASGPAGARAPRSAVRARE